MKLYEILRKLAPGDLTLVEILHEKDILDKLEDYEDMMFKLADILEYNEFNNRDNNIEIQDDVI